MSRNTNTKKEHTATISEGVFDMADETGDAVDTFPAHDAFSIQRVTVGVASAVKRDQC